MNKKSFFSNSWVLVLLLFFFFFDAWGQKNSDKELGFDAAMVRKELAHDKSLDSNEIENEIIRRRKDLIKFKEDFAQYIKDKEMSINQRALPNMTMDICDQLNFNAQNPFSTWEVFTSNISSNAGIAINEINWLPANNSSIMGDLLFPGSAADARTARFRAMDYESYLGDMDPVYPDIPLRLLSTTGSVQQQNIDFPGGQGNIIARIGNSITGADAEMLSRTIRISGPDDVIRYSFAVVFQGGVSGHSVTERPRFVLRFSTVINGQTTVLQCAEYTYVTPGTGGDGISDSFLNINNSIFYRPWTSHVIRPYTLLENLAGPIDIKIEAMALDCTLGGHYGYAYFDVDCGEMSDQSTIIVQGADEAGRICIGSPVTIKASLDNAVYTNYRWAIIDPLGNQIYSSVGNQNPFSFNFSTPGEYMINFSAHFSQDCGQNVPITSQRVLKVEKCHCIDCTSFDLLKNEKYLVSAWVKEEDISNPNAQYKKYEKASVNISFSDTGGTAIGSTLIFKPSGEIIDGWQRIIGEFVVPDNVDDMFLELVNNDTAKTIYFDDVRVLPTKGNMKSFVYDQETHRLMAELDENNYSTFYEYDLEGGLVRIKKETEKGVFTIQETRSGNKKTSLSDD